MGKFLSELHAQLFAVAFVAGVLGNLTASLLLGGPAFWHLHKKLNRHHKEHMDKLREINDHSI